MVRTIGIVPARSGSKRLPGKNLALLAGRPLIVHTCCQALDSGVLDAVYVNTDCERIAAAAQRAGALCPRLRPSQLARDDTPTRDAVVWMIDLLADRGEFYDALMILQPTSPLRTADDIRAAWRLYEDHAPCKVTSVTPQAPQCWHALADDRGLLTRLTGNEPLYRLNGAIYVHAVDEFLANKPSPAEVAYVMPPERSVDIDTQHDLDLCEFLLTHSAAEILAAREGRE